MAGRKRKQSGPSPSPIADPDQAVDYEKLRNDRIAENRRRMLELGLPSLSESISSEPRTFSRSKTIKPKPISLGSHISTRRSSRLLSLPAPSYKDLSEKEMLAVPPLRTHDLKPEIYTEEHEKLLGSSELKWELFKDGYRPDGTRIYDPVDGKTCHQCRQKTVGHRTSCSECKLVQGQFCGDCLYMRYGENVLESLKNKNWKCPVCRNICNCSICRTRKGWAPTGSLYRKVLELGYKSVAHYLILTRREVDKSEVKEEDLQDISEPSSKRMLTYDSQELHTAEHAEAKKDLQMREHLDNKDGIEMVELVDTKRKLQLMEHFDNKDDIETAEHLDAKPCAKLVSASSNVYKQDMSGVNDLVEVGDVKAKRSKTSKCTEAKLPQKNEIIVIGDETDNSARKTQLECQSIAQRLCRRRLRPRPPLSLKGQDFVLNMEYSTLRSINALFEQYDKKHRT